MDFEHSDVMLFACLSCWCGHRDDWLRNLHIDFCLAICGAPPPPHPQLNESQEPELLPNSVTRSKLSSGRPASVNYASGSRGKGGATWGG